MYVLTCHLLIYGFRFAVFTAGCLSARIDLIFVMLYLYAAFHYLKS